MFFNKKKEVLEEKKPIPKIINYQVLKIDYENFYSFSPIVNDYDTITRRLLYEPAEKKVIVAQLYDKNIVDFSSLKN